MIDVRVIVKEWACHAIFLKKKNEDTMRCFLSVIITITDTS